MGTIKGDTGMAHITVGCGRHMGAIRDASTIPCVVGSGWSCVSAGAWLLVMLVKLSEEQLGAVLIKFKKKYFFKN